ncbi:MAG: hypothetical protein DBP02_02075 [gamma proteobacterium symbiont of Ctena orbiculata]|nr:MAG: hypothetical protein DBP02_02075 [gamma proteobacterium symbiont of Ctena orbiculata]
MPKVTEIVPDDMPDWAKKAFDDGQFFNKACKAMNSLEEIREIYAGMDGFIPKTAPEAYQERIIRQMYQCAIDGIET